MYVRNGLDNIVAGVNILDKLVQMTLHVRRYTRFSVFAMPNILIYAKMQFPSFALLAKTNSLIDKDACIDKLRAYTSMCFAIPHDHKSAKHCLLKDNVYKISSNKKR